jgi:HSP20 family protein
MYESLWSFPGGVMGDFDRLRRELDDVFSPHSLAGSIRSVAPGAFPAINVGRTTTSVEVDAFAPGIDPAKIDVVIDRGVLTISGERASALPPQQPGDKPVSVYSRERSSGAFKRAISLPDDVDPTHVRASYRDGVLNVSIARRESAQPQRITVQ